MSVCLFGALFLGTGEQLLERKERVELRHTERDMLPRGALMRTSLDCAMGQFLGTLLLLLGAFCLGAI